MSKQNATKADMYNLVIEYAKQYGAAVKDEFASVNDVNDADEIPAAIEAATNVEGYLLAELSGMIKLYIRLFCKTCADGEVFSRQINNAYSNARN